MTWHVEGRLPTKFAALDYIKAHAAADKSIPTAAIGVLIAAISVMPDPAIGQNVYFKASGHVDERQGSFSVEARVDPIFPG